MAVVANGLGSSAATILSECNTVVINTGNIINLNELKRKTTQDSTEEVIESLSVTISKWATLPHSNEEKGKDIYCRPVADKIKIVTENRKDIKITVKIFATSEDPTILSKLIDKVLDELGLDSVELVILAFPPSQDGAPVPDSAIQALWQVLEEQVARRTLLTIGVSDLDTDQLRNLHTWAKVKPLVNHVNLASCCVMPPEMTAFAKENDIQLLTHNDPRDLIPDSQVSRLFQRLGEQPLGDWKVQWVVRYSALIKCRGVIQNKGFLAALRRNN